MTANYPREEWMDRIVSNLSSDENIRSRYSLRRKGASLPSANDVCRIVELCRCLLFPTVWGEINPDRLHVRYHAGVWGAELYQLLTAQIAIVLSLDIADAGRADMDAMVEVAGVKARTFMESLPDIRRVLLTDVEATYLGDPAAISPEEVLCCYPGVLATCHYRIAHVLVDLGVPLLPRMIAELAHSRTGIDIHPAATIGESFIIDHGTGVVIGATAILGRNVKLYQGVTLGARSFDMDENNNPVKGIPRHPVIGDNVIIYSNTTVLGRISIGSNAVIGGNLWVTEDVAEGEKLVQARPDNILRFKQ